MLKHLHQAKQPKIHLVGDPIVLSIQRYKTSLSEAVTGLWREQWTMDEFLDAMEAAVQRNLKIGFLEGASECGLIESELSKVEIKARDDYINEQLTFALDFGKDITALRDEYPLAYFRRRADTWANRYREIEALGNQLVCGNLKKVWEIDPTKDNHCCDCLNMEGRIYRNEIWLKHSIRPGSINLACFGGFCGCKLTTTDQPLTKGTPPRLRGPGGC